LLPYALCALLLLPEDFLRLIGKGQASWFLYPRRLWKITL
jgi:hypothetical protein